MKTQIDRANILRSLHIKGDPLVLFNIWDAGSARVVEEAGARALATGSWAVAASHGYSDGEELPLDLVLGNLRRIMEVVSLPVSVDIEGGYGKSPSEIQGVIGRVIEAGAVGVNFEDRVIDGKGLYSIEEQCSRIKAVHKAAREASMPLFINARTDIFFRHDNVAHNDSHLKEAVRRAVAYAKSGADGLFVPGLKSPRYIEKLCQLSPLPVNLLVLSYPIPAMQFARLGVARISYGPSPYCQMMDELKKAAHKAFSNYFLNLTYSNY